MNKTFVIQNKEHWQQLSKPLLYIDIDAIPSNYSFKEILRIYNEAGFMYIRKNPPANNNILNYLPARC